MKKKVITTEKKLSLEKFKVAELKNPKMIMGGLGAIDGGNGGNGDDDNNTITLPTVR